MLHHAVAVRCSAVGRPRPDRGHRYCHAAHGAAVGIFYRRTNCPFKRIVRPGYCCHGILVRYYYNRILAGIARAAAYRSAHVVGARNNVQDLRHTVTAGRPGKYCPAGYRCRGYDYAVYRGGIGVFYCRGYPAFDRIVRAVDCCRRYCVRYNGHRILIGIVIHAVYVGFHYIAARIHS